MTSMVIVQRRLLFLKTKLTPVGFGNIKNRFPWQYQVQVRDLQWVPRAYRRPTPVSDVGPGKTAAFGRSRSNPGLGPSKPLRASRPSRPSKRVDPAGIGLARPGRPVIPSALRRRKGRFQDTAGTSSSSDTGDGGPGHSHRARHQPRGGHRRDLRRDARDNQRGGDEKLRQRSQYQSSQSNKLDDNILHLENDLRGMVSKYRSVLASSRISEKETETDNEIEGNIQQSHQRVYLADDDSLRSPLLSSLHSTDSIPPWEKIMETEEIFRGICRLVGTLVSKTARRTNQKQIKSHQRQLDKYSRAVEGKENLQSHCHISDQYFRSWLKIRSDRKRLVQAAREEKIQSLSKKEEQDAISWVRWLQNTLSFSTDNQTESAKEDVRSLVMAHDEEDNAPNPMHFQRLVDTIVADENSKFMGSKMDPKQTSAPSNLQKMGAGDAYAKGGQENLHRYAPSESCAKRLAELFQLVSSNEIVPNLQTVRLIMHTLANVGSLETAQQCEEIYDTYLYHYDYHPNFKNKQTNKNPPNQSLFNIVLRAYCSVASHFEHNKAQNPHNQAKAAKRAEYLVRTQWESVVGPRTGGNATSWNDTDTSRSTTRSNLDRSIDLRSSGSNTSKHEDTKINKNKMFFQCSKVLSCFQGAGVNVLPDVCDRADRLVQMCMGEKQFQQLMQFIMERENEAETTGTSVKEQDIVKLLQQTPPTLTLPLLDHLVQIHASSGDPHRLTQAKQMLIFMFNANHYYSTIDSNHVHNTMKYQSEQLLFPDIKTCKSIVHAILRLNSKENKVSNANASVNARDSNGSSPIAEQNVFFVMKLVRRMLAQQNERTWPDQEFFFDFFRLVLKTKAKDLHKGIVAEEILSLMEMTKSFLTQIDTNEHLKQKVTRKSYHFVLLCWLESAKAACPNAAKHAELIVQRMEAQAIPLLPISASSTSGMAEGSTANNVVIEPTTERRGLSPSRQLTKLYEDDLMPSRRTYFLLMNVCGATQIASEKQGALDIALNSFNRIKHHNRGSYKIFFDCCSDLMPEEATKRTQVIRRIQLILEQGHDTCNHGSVNETFINGLEALSNKS